MTVIAPIVHLNGTGKQGLIDPLCEAIDALDEAGRLLAKTAPNARDYYVGPPGLFESAARQHDDRMRIVRALLADLSDQLAAVEDQ